MLLPLEIPPGIASLGTELQSVGRWRDGNLVRWRGGVMQPVGGWQQRTSDPLGDPPRGAHVWVTNSGDRLTATGTFDSLFALNASGTVTDITPTGLDAGLQDAEVNFGYGYAIYGEGSYGTPRPDTGNIIEAASWSLDNWGENLVACMEADGRLFEWPRTGLAAPITNAPADCAALMVTEERFLFALAAGGNPRKIQWSDQEDNTSWTPSATNQAGDIELATRGRIMCGVRTRGQALILTDQDAHTATYQGPPFVYGFERVGTACGVASRMAAATVDAGVFWMGTSGFHRYAGGAVEPVDCDVLDAVFSDINRSQISKVWAAPLAQLGEVWWFYPSGGSNEIDRYVAFSFVEGHWSLGRLSRTAGIPSGVFRDPIWFDTDGAAYDHESGANLHGCTSFVRSGPVQIGVGNNVMAAVRLMPDERTQGQTQARFYARFHPNGPEVAHGPYAMAAPTDVRFTGRQVEVEIIGAPLVPWRVGIPRLEVRQRGRR